MTYITLLLSLTLRTASASYIFHSSAASQLLAAYPNAKLNVLLRDPVLRAFSHYRMSTRERLTTADSVEFHEQMVSEIRAYKECVYNQQLLTQLDMTLDYTVDLSTAPMPVLSKCADVDVNGQLQLRCQFL